MAATSNNVLRMVTPPADSGRLLAQGLADLYKAVKGASFYPDGHPYRTAPLQRAFEALTRLVEKREVVLTVGRQGFAPAVEGGDGNVMVQQLAQECLMRRIASVTFSPSLQRSDLETFVELLSGDPHKVSPGGIARQLEAAGVRSVRVQERDLSAAWAKRTAAAAPGKAVPEEDAVREPAQGAPPDPDESHTIPELLRLMAHEGGDARYQQLARELAERSPQTSAGLAVVPVLGELLRQHEEPQRSLPQREYALFILERLAEQNGELLLDALFSREYPDREGILRVLAALGGKGAYRIIQRLCLAQGVAERKALAGALVRLGPAATAPVIAMLKDDRWYVVRNMAAILGEIRAPEAVAALGKPLRHEDERVRKEAVRALMKIGGEEAEAALIRLLDEEDLGLARHAVISLGLMRSRPAVAPLLKLLERQDLLLKTLPLKREAALALGRIGDAAATAALVDILAVRGWPVPGRWHELKGAAVSALGTLGDEAALPPLKRISRGSGALARACRDAVEAIESVSGASQH